MKDDLESLFKIQVVPDDRCPPNQVRFYDSRDGRLLGTIRNVQCGRWAWWKFKARLVWGVLKGEIE